ncbi:cysteine proteinase, partial [Martensiomyces pterosporus]
LFTYHATSIYGRDPLTLQEGQWVNDTILSFYFEYLTHDILKGDNSILFLAPCLSYFLTHQQNLHELQRALPDNLHTKELIFIPVNNRALGGAGEGGTHWSLLVYVRQSDTYHYFDSLANRNYRCALLTKRNLSQLLSVYLGGAAREPNVVAHSCPQQENDFDCGVFVILFVDLLARRYA